MCGIICGNFKNRDKELFHSLSLLSKRGPDNSNLYINDNIFLGHTLLSIFSNENDIQPLWSNDQSIVVCVNGEIYNYYELRIFLETKGYIFTTESDSEIFVHGIHHYGKNFFQYINGDFAVVSYNFIKKEWICAVDQYGTKPLRYYLNSGKFLISSNIKSLKSFLDLSIDIQSCLFSLATQCLPIGKTLFKNIHSIPSGHILTVNNNFSNLEKYETIFKTKDSIEHLLERSILNRVPKNKKLSLVLSSGIDSSTIAYYLTKNKVEFQSYAIDFPGTEFSEIENIKQFAQRHNISLKIISIYNKDLLNNFVDTVYNSENLSINPHAVGKLLVNKKMLEDGYKVCLTGDGADELFFGYPHFHTNNQYQFLTESEYRAKLVKELLLPNIEFNISPIQKENNTVQNLYINYWLSEYGLKILGDSQSAEIGQEHRYPYLDQILYKKLLNEKDFKNQNKPSKMVLRNIVRKWDNILADIPKKPFASPPLDKTWLPMFENFVINNDKFFNIEIFDKNKLIQYIYKLNSIELPNRIILTQILSLGILIKNLT